MTEDFKDKLLKYFTGNFQEGTTSYTYYQSDIETNINNLYQTISNEVGNQYTGEFFITGVLQAKTPGNVESNIYIMYGYSQGSTLHPHDFGFIVLIDNNFNVLDILTEYSSGTIFGEFNCLNVDENGYLYGIETNYNSTQKRFIMLNNVAIKLLNENYQVKIRKTYNLPNDINSNLYNIIKKEIGESNYLIVGISSGNPILIKLKIIVGAPNEWTTYNYSDSYTISNLSLLDVYETWNSGNLITFNMLCTEINSGNYNVIQFYLSNNVLKYSGGILVNLTDIFSITGKYSINSDIILGIIKSDYSTYMEHDIITYLPGSGLMPFTIYSKTGDYYGTGASINNIQINGLDIYYNEMIQTNATDYNCEIGRIIINGNNVNTLPVFNQIASSGSRYFYNYLFVTKQNNLYTFNMQVENIDYIVKQEFNLNDYLTGAIDNTQYFIPKSINLYNNTELLFSKELYNLTVNDNITVATAEISNMSLNNITITNENLKGSTYQNLVEAGVEFTKNQYEVVDVNFINTIGIQNKNSETIQEVEGQNRLNDSVSQTTDYEDARMTRYRINYQDGTTLTNSNIWYPIANYFTTDLTISVSKEISSIEFISEDEQTTYTTIYPVLEVGKTYKISQDVFLKEKGSPQQIYYNTDEVYYGSDEVYH